MKGTILELVVPKPKGEPRESTTSLTLIEGVGIEGSPYLGGDRQVCIFTDEARQWIKSQEIIGLCFKRFQENVLLSDFQTETLQIGNRIKVGETILEITATKPCFDECERYSNHLPCRIRACVKFAAVKTGGVITVGDTVTLLET